MLLILMGRYFFMTSILIVTGLCAGTYGRNAIYADDVTLYQDTIIRSPNKARPFNNLGDALKKAGRTGEAAPYLERALAIQPEYPDALNNLATVYSSMGRRDAALDLLLTALRLNPDHLEARHNLALAYYESGLIVEAEEQYRLLMQFAPGSHEAAFARDMLKMIENRRSSP
ncbi:MAG: tetratricopeptide repeat protein [Nitrospirota bacterium]|nr:tetratricopeptide repeat protein [Nitrospirota bacterium]